MKQTQYPHEWLLKKIGNILAAPAPFWFSTTCILFAIWNWILFMGMVFFMDTYMEAHNLLRLGNQGLIQDLLNLGPFLILILFAYSLSSLIQRMGARS